MSDVAISYSSSQRPAALRVAQQLREAGRTIWLDDASDVDESLGAVGVPVGQPHWSVIAGAIDDALALLVLDSPDWRASAYCRREYAHALARGKPIAVIQVSDSPPVSDVDAPVATWQVKDLDGLVAGIDANGDVLAAHARLVRAHLNGERGDTGRLWRLPLSTLVTDAEAVLASDSDRTGIGVTDAIVAFSDRVQRAHRRRQRALVATGSAVLAIVLGLAVTALIARSAALDSEIAANEAASTQQSLQLAAEALRADTTVAAQGLASEALQLASSEAAIAASRQIAAEIAERHRLRLDDRVLAAAISDDGTIAVFGVGRRQDGQQIVAIDIEQDLETARFDVPQGFRERFLEVTPDNRHAVFVGDDSGKPLAADLATGSLRSLDLGDFTAVAVDDLGRLWWTTQDGRVFRSSDLDRFSEAHEVASVDGRPTALAVHGAEAGFDVLLDGDEAIVFARSSESGDRLAYEPVSTVQLFDDFGTGVAITDQDPPYAPDRLLRCGTSVAAIRAGRPALATPTDAFPATGSVTGLIAQSSRISGHACVGDAVVTVQFRGPPLVVPADHWLPPDLLLPSEAAGSNVLATSRSGEHLVFSRPSGLVDIIRLPSSRRSFPVGASFLVAPLRGEFLLVADDGVVQSRTLGGDSPSRLGRLASPPRATTPLIVGEKAVFGTESGVSIVDSDGVRIEHDLGAGIGSVQAYGDAGLVAASASSLFVMEDIDASDGVVVTELRDIESPEAIVNMAVGTDERVYVTTNLGRLVEVDLWTGATRNDIQNSPALSDTSLLVLPRHPDGLRVLTHSSDGRLSVFDADLQRHQQLLMPGSGRVLQASPDDRTILAGTVQGDLLVLDSASLEIVQRLATDRMHARSYLFDESSEDIVGIELIRSSASDSGWANRLDVLPVRSLPTHPEDELGVAHPNLGPED